MTVGGSGVRSDSSRRKMGSFPTISCLLKRVFFLVFFLSFFLSFIPFKGVGWKRRKSGIYVCFNIVFCAEIAYMPLHKSDISLMLSVNSERYLICYCVFSCPNCLRTSSGSSGI